MRYNLDRISILGRVLYIEGWGEDVSPQIIYGGNTLPVLFDRVVREDVARFFGDAAAAQWGFVLTALLPSGPFERSKLVLKLRSDTEVVDPARYFVPQEDKPAIDMINGFIEMVGRTKGSLLEIGSRARSGVSYRGLFPSDIDYLGIDITAGDNVELVCDAHKMSSYIDRKFDYIFSISVFEHLLMPWKVAIEMSKVLKPGGVAYIQSHCGYPLHDTPWDFWRFSTDAWRAIFNEHTGFKVVDAQHRYPAQIVPTHFTEPGHETVSAGETFLVSACLAQKVGDPVVEWAADPSTVYDLAYSYANV